MSEVKQIKVSGKTNVQQLSYSIVSLINKGHDVEVRAMGASAVSQMYKGITVARGTVALKGKDLLIRPGFCDISEDENGEEKSKTVMTARLIVT